LYLEASYRAGLYAFRDADPKIRHFLVGRECAITQCIKTSRNRFQAPTDSGPRVLQLGALKLTTRRI
jgi:hypothetical protein